MAQPPHSAQAPVSEGSALAPEERQLLQRILASPRFAHAHLLKRVLQYVCERSADPAAPPPKEHEIAIEAMGRPVSFDPRTDPIDLDDEVVHVECIAHHVAGD